LTYISNKFLASLKFVYTNTPDNNVEMHVSSLPSKYHHMSESLSNDQL